MKQWLTSSSGTLADKYKYYILPFWAILVVAYLRYKAPQIWQADWTHDDLMNAYWAMTNSWSDLSKQAALFWQPSPVFRPLGEMFYKLFWEQFGFDGLPWRVGASAFLIGNAFLIGHVAMRLSGSISVGLAATAAASFHSLWTHLYLNTGTIFEILAFSLVFAGLAYYIEFHDPWGTTLLLILGLNAKESAVILPALVVLYEWIWRRRTPWLFCALSATVCLAFIVGRVYGPAGISTVGSYQPVYSFATYLNSFRGYLGPLILWKEVPLWAAPLIAALPLLLRNKLGIFAAAMFPVAILPLAFVPDRGLEGVYIACAALPLAVSALLLKIPKEDFRLAGAVAVFAITAITMPGLSGIEGWQRENQEIRSFRESLLNQLPQLPPRVQIRFVSEPFTADYPWASTFITRLLYKNPDIVVVSPMNEQTRNFPASNDFASFQWQAGKLQRIK